MGVEACARARAESLQYDQVGNESCSSGFDPTAIYAVSAISAREANHSCQALDRFAEYYNVKFAPRARGDLSRLAFSAGAALLHVTLFAGGISRKMRDIAREEECRRLLSFHPTPLKISFAGISARRARSKGRRDSEKYAVARNARDHLFDPRRRRIVYLERVRAVYETTRTCITYITLFTVTEYRKVVADSSWRRHASFKSNNDVSVVESRRQRTRTNSIRRVRYLIRSTMISRCLSFFSGVAAESPCSHIVSGFPGVLT